MQRNSKVWLIQRGKKKSIDAIPKKDIMANTLDKDFKGNALKMPNRLKEDMEKAKKRNKYQ